MLWSIGVSTRMMATAETAPSLEPVVHTSPRYPWNRPAGNAVLGAWLPKQTDTRMAGSTDMGYHHPLRYPESAMRTSLFISVDYHN